jgi:hypothetical protein
MAGSVGVMSLSQYVYDYQRHPESKAADAFGNPAGVDTIGVLGRLRIEPMPVKRIGKS